MRILNRTPFATRADLVVVGAHDGFDYAELRTATQAVLRGAELIGATRDATFPMPDGPWPGTGAVLAAVEAATGRRAALVVGKPEPAMYEAARDRLGPGRILAVGDLLEVDVAGARRAGLDSALVLTGGTTREEADAAEPPDVRGRLARRAGGGTNFGWVRQRGQPRPDAGSPRTMCDYPRFPTPTHIVRARRPSRLLTLPAAVDVAGSTERTRRRTASLLARMDRPVRLIVNPSAGAGRARKLLPGVERRCARTASPSASTARPRSSTPASSRARRARPARSPPRWAATGSSARSPASSAATA